MRVTVAKPNQSPAPKHEPPSASRPQVDVHPIQTECCHRGGACPTAVTMRAYEVYRHCFGAQEALVTGHCRGGFGVGELVAFLYAYPFPKNEWHKRVDQAMRGFKLGVRRP